MYFMDVRVKMTMSKQEVTLPLTAMIPRRQQVVNKKTVISHFGARLKTWCQIGAKRFFKALKSPDISGFRRPSICCRGMQTHKLRFFRDLMSAPWRP
jgi:hypothetical protein